MSATPERPKPSAPVATALAITSIEAELTVYPFGNPENGAGPMWCYGSTCIVRRGGDVFVSGLEILPDQKPLTNVRWTLFRLTDKGVELVQADPTERQREPCPLGLFADGRLLLSSNPSVAGPEVYKGPARPEVLVFDTGKPAEPPRALLPVWKEVPPFTEHSYRAFCVDAAQGEALCLQNVWYDRAYWSFLDRTGAWSKCGILRMPWGAEFEKPVPVRVCYQNMALRDRAAHLLGVSDIIEPIREWREYKLVLHDGNVWDYDFRRLYYCHTPDIAREDWSPWVLVADCDKTCGLIRNLDLWLDGQGRAHILWREQNVWDKRVRNKFFPDVPQTFALMYGIVDRGQVVLKTRLAFGGERQDSQEMPGYGRFQATPDGRLFVFYYVGGVDANKAPVSENRLVELNADGTAGTPVRVGLEHPFTDFMTAGERGGSAPSNTLDILGLAKDKPGISYARIKLPVGR